MSSVGNRQIIGEPGLEQQGTQDPPSTLPTDYVTRPGVVTYICIASLIGMVVQIPWVMFNVNAQSQFSAELQFISYALVALMYGGFAAIVLGLWRAKNWARMTYVVLFPLLAILQALADLNITSIVRLSIISLVCILLFRPKASAFFRGEALAPIDPASRLEIGDRKIIRCPSCDKEIYSTVTSCHHCGTDLTQESAQA